MQKSLRKLLVLGKELSIFTGILLVLLFVFSCNNMINIRGGGNLIIAIPGARAATASSFTIELTGSSGATQNKTVSGGSTIQFDDLAPDTYTISVKGMDDAGTVVFSGSAKATVVAGETATVTVDLESALGNLTVSFEGAESDSVAEYTVILSGPNESKETQEVTDRTVQFEGLIPGDYTVSVEGKNGDVVVLAGTPSKVTVEAGKTKSVIVELQKLLGSLTVNFEGADDSTDTSFTFELTDLEGKTISDGSSSQFDNLAPGTYNVVVKGTQNNVLVFYGTTRENVKPSENTTATVPLIKGVSDFAGLQAAVAAGGIVNVLTSIDVEKTLSISNTVTIVPVYQDVTLKNTGSGNLFTVAASAGNLTIGGGEYTITLDGNQVTQSIIKMTAGTATLTDNGIITNAAASAVYISYSGSSSGTFEMTGGTIMNNTSSSGGAVSLQGATFKMSGGILKDNKSSGAGGAISMSSGTCTITGGSITGNTAQNRGGGVFMSGGTFELLGGSISNNSATQGSGVQVTVGTFKMGGSGVVALNNDVCLSTNYKITITGKLTGASPVATVTLDPYSEDTQILQVENNVVLADEVKKFTVTDKSWTINTEGKLQKVQ